MEWLSNWIMKEGKGIPKNAPKKTGLPLFASIVGREAWELFKLNLMMLLLAIPIVTIPASFAAACRLSVVMIEDDVFFLWRDFWRAFTASFFRATGLGIGFAFILAIGGYALFIYGQLAAHEFLYLAPAALAVFVIVLTMMIAVCSFTLMAKRNLATRQLIKSAFLAALAKPLPILAGICFAVLLWLLHILFYPASVFLPVVLNFSLGTLAMVFGAFKATNFALGLIEPTGSSQVVDNLASTTMPFHSEEKI